MGGHTLFCGERRDIVWPAWQWGPSPPPAQGGQCGSSGGALTAAVAFPPWPSVLPQPATHKINLLTSLSACPPTWVQVRSYLGVPARGAHATLDSLNRLLATVLVVYALWVALTGKRI